VRDEERQMVQQQQVRWRPTRRQLLWGGGIAALVFLGIVIGGYLFEWKWTGLPKRTLWDWLQLLIIPAVLAGVGLWFNRQQREQELRTADRRSQDEALQAYLNQMSEMLIPPSKDLPSLYKARPGDRLRAVARARTLTVLPRLAGDGKARVVQFLYESGLISGGRPILVLTGANLSGANLSEAELSGADLREADLSEADLMGAVEITNEKLKQEAKSLTGATMPNGQMYEDWLKSKGIGKDEKNE
jgi:Pentapeptide repeats (8 copies)